MRISDCFGVTLYRHSVKKSAKACGKVAERPVNTDALLQCNFA